MFAWIVGAVLLALAHKAKQLNGEHPTGTVVSVGTPSFGVRSVNEAGAPQSNTFSREPGMGTWQEWQAGQKVPVPAGSRADHYATGAARSDSARNQDASLQIINPPQTDEQKRVAQITGGAGSGSGGTVIINGGGASSSSGGSTGRGFSPGGGGSFGGGGRSLL